MEFAIISQDIKFIKANMIDTIENWDTLLNNRDIFKNPEFISFISEYPMDWFIEHIEEIIKIRKYYFRRLFKYRNDLVLKLLPVFIRYNIFNRLVPFQTVYKKVPPVLQVLLKVINFHSFDEVDKLFQWIFEENKSEFIEIIMELQFIYYKDKPMVTYIHKEWAKYHCMVLYNDQKNIYESIYWSFILGKINDTPNLRLIDLFTLVNMAIITGKTDTLEKVLLDYGHSISPDYYIIDAYSDYDRLCSLIKKIPGQKIRLSKTFIKNGCQIPAVLTEFITIDIGDLKYMTIDILRKYENLLPKEINITVIMHNYDIWNYVCFLIYYKGIDINICYKSWLGPWRHRCTELVQDLGMDLNNKMFDEVLNILWQQGDTFTIKNLISNGFKSTLKIARPFMRLQRIKNAELKQILPLDLIFFEYYNQ